MGKTHELKTDPEVFEAVAKGLKTHEIRYNDRDFQVGDTLKLRETFYTGAEMKAGKPLAYTNRDIVVTVTHVLTGPIYGLAEGWAILSIAAPPGALDEVVEAAETAITRWGELQRQREPVTQQQNAEWWLMLNTLHEALQRLKGESPVAAENKAAALRGQDLTELARTADLIDKEGME
jgi:hypothetical protein